MDHADRLYPLPSEDGSITTHPTMKNTYPRCDQNHRHDPDGAAVIHSGLLAVDLPPLPLLHTNGNRHDMTLHPATPADLAPIKALLADVDLPYEDLAPSHLSDFLVAHDGDQLIGVAGLERYGTDALLRSLAVRPNHRGEGHGSRLAEAVEASAREQNVTDVYLLTTTAASFFAERGYSEVDRDDLPRAIRQTEEAANLCPETATSLHKRLA